MGAVVAFIAGVPAFVLAHPWCVALWALAVLAGPAYLALLRWAIWYEDRQERREAAQKYGLDRSVKHL